MGTILRRLKAQLKGKILSVGKCLSRKNRLTEHEIDNLQSYYGSAIRRNHSSVQNMRQAIWAIFLHKLSTDEYPQHGFCPIGKIHGVDLKRLKHQALPTSEGYNISSDGILDSNDVVSVNKWVKGLKIRRFFYSSHQGPEHF
ncbi:uncharacterized protein TNCV_2649231 [Trichonephila clavipes]|nr:uncharacterized protein TNCV_2649231 [Trichonephila clavipes]